ncbi:RHS repeat-associated core domain-containing protein [Cobetia marina]|uniref:RHS repeat-associated core domain-containing protein n=1 Tax=Cobetia marina TaxID=28258 RepID=A0ABU9GIT7_COBMA
MSEFDNDQQQLPVELVDRATAMRVVTSDPSAEPVSPAVDIQTEPEDSTMLDIVIQAAYMVPVLGNVMAVGDVARDIVELCDDSPQGESNFENPWLWAILVIDAIGIIPAAGNASRPVRVASREAILAFIRGEGIAIVAQLLWNNAGGDAIEFVSKMQNWVKEQQPLLRRFASSTIGGIEKLVADPVDGAEQLKLIEENPSWWEVDEHGKRIVLQTFDALVHRFGEDQRQQLLGSLRQLKGVTDKMIVVAIDNLMPVLIALGSALIARRNKSGRVDHQGQAVAGASNHSQRGAQKRQSTTDERQPSDTPAGCACGLATSARQSPNPIDYAMGDENLWQTDFRVAGLIDVEWTRYYRSSIDALDDSELGARWNSPYHMRFEQRATGLVFVDGLNRALALEPIAIGEQRFLARESMTLAHPEADSYTLTYLDGSVERYQRVGDPTDAGATHYRLVEQRERDGRALTLSYQQGRLASLADGAELELHFLYSNAGLLERIVRHYPSLEDGAPRHEPEVLARYAHDDQGNLVSHRNARDDQREYHYTHHLLTRYTNLNGVGVNLTWGWPGKAEGALPVAREARCVRNALDDGSEDTRFEYHRELWYTKVTDAQGVVSIYRYNFDNYIESITRPHHPELGSEYWQWNAEMRLVAHTDGEGRMTRYRYDAQGRMTAVTDPLGLTTLVEYNSQGLPTKVTDPEGRVRMTRFDPRGLPVEEIAPTGRKTTFKHNAQGLLEAMTDAAGNTYRYEWNPQGLLLSASDCSNKTTHYHYDHRGHISEVVDAADQRTRYQLDIAGLPASIRHADGATETFTHDGEGNLIRHVDPAGHQTRYRYNAKHQPIERRDPLGQTLSYHYDPLLRLKQLVNQNGDHWDFHYDGGSRLIRERGFDGRTKQYRYDGAGSLESLQEGEQITQFARDPLGRLLSRQTELPGQLPLKTTFGYDPLGRLIRAANDDSETRFYFDDVDNLIAESQQHQLPNGHQMSAVTRHTHDALGNRETTTLPDGQQISWLRYGSGHVLSMALNNEELLGFERDDLHREVRRHQRGRETTSQYDPVGRLISQHSQLQQRGSLQGAAVQVTAGHGKTSAIKRRWQYADNGLLTATDDSLRGTTRYGYDALGRLRQAVSPLREEHFAFDPAGNLVESDRQGTDASDSTQATRWTQERPRDGLDHTPESRVRVDFPNAPKLSSAMGNLLKRYAGTHYHYDTYGNLTRRIEPNGQTWHYQYDAEHRMVEASRYAQAPAAGDNATPLTHARYAYDSMGRRIWKQVTQQGNAPELTAFTWDGDLLQSEEKYQGHLSGMAHAPLLALDVEDPSRSYSTPIAQRQHTLGHLANVIPQRRVSYLFEANSFIPAAKLETRFEAIEQQTGTGQSGYTRYQPSAAELYYFQTDHLGTPLEVADSEGNLVWVGQYRAWGQLERAQDGNGERASTDNPLRFQGQYHDEETGLHYNRFRYYDPAVGRFTTQDPIGLMGGENLYQYAPNPTGWVDPLGLSKCCNDKNKKTSYQGVSRRAALREAKRDAGIPNSQNPVVRYKPLRDGNGKKIINSDGFPVNAREYHYADSDGSSIIIQEHSMGHDKAVPLRGAEPHFNIRPSTNLDTGSVVDTHGHYNF